MEIVCSSHTGLRIPDRVESQVTEFSILKTSHVNFGRRLYWRKKIRLEMKSHLTCSANKLVNRNRIRKTIILDSDFDEANSWKSHSIIGFIIISLTNHSKLSHAPPSQMQYSSFWIGVFNMSLLIVNLIKIEYAKERKLTFHKSLPPLEKCYWHDNQLTLRSQRLIPHRLRKRFI